MLREYEYPSRSEVRRCRRRAVQKANRWAARPAARRDRSVSRTSARSRISWKRSKRAGVLERKRRLHRVSRSAARRVGDEMAAEPQSHAYGRADGREWIVSTRALHDPSGSAPTTRECRYSQIDREGARQVRLANLGYTLGLSAAVAMLFACGGSQPSIGLVPSTGVPDHLPNHKPFYFTGRAQDFRVPEGVTNISVVARGAKGAGNRVAFGGRVTAVIRVTPGEKLVFTSAATRPENRRFQRRCRWRS